MSEVEELVGLMAAFYQADGAMNATDSRHARRDAQTIVCAEILRLLDGDTRTLSGLRDRGLVPLTLADLPKRLGGTSDA